ncbi:MAG: 1,4-alpha-glucan branching protein GlgB, partial [Pseudomonadota bacterium]
MTVSPESVGDAMEASALSRIIEARHHDPFEVLGMHQAGQGVVVRVFLPEADLVTLNRDLPMTSLGGGIFEWRGSKASLTRPYRVRWREPNGNYVERFDPYCFEPQLADFDLDLFGFGRLIRAYELLGAHPATVDGIDGVRFAVWAPTAERVSVIGHFNHWDGRRAPMRRRGQSGVWELFVPDLGAETIYKFEIRSARGEILQKSDPYGQLFEARPGTASVVAPRSEFRWGDARWMQHRREHDWQRAPLSAYEVHLGSWKRDEHGFINYRTLAEELVPYVVSLGFTHIELLPVTEHPLDESWGYQTTGYFAPTSRFGDPDDFRYFVDYCHQHRIGVILDWVPGHFPRDAHGLARFDGTALYEHEDARQGEHREWGTLIFNFGRAEVKNFLISSAVYWLREFHIDGLRVDAVASMLYLNYARDEGDWLPNAEGGSENLDAIAFLKELSDVVHAEAPGVMTIAEDSTSWPQVTKPPEMGGLGFSMKWNMGWMNDTLDYFEKDPVYRAHEHQALTFGMIYAYSENYVLPFSHDEVVHGKRSLLSKMPGDEWQQFANLRALLAYQWTYPGKKLVFMGTELAMRDEWYSQRELPWGRLNDPKVRGIHQLLGDLNRLYREHPALYANEFEASGFMWIDCHDAAHSLLSYERTGMRNGDDETLIVVLNFTPVPRIGYRIGLPRAGHYRELLNSDAKIYGGEDVGNSGEIEAHA